jgi:formylglycine-generating enzyme required for sulfatase activity
MIVVGSGEYLVGENSAKQVNISAAYALSATPITVSQYEAFINSTGYQTDAELKKICTTVENSQIIPITDSYWRNPGFKQSSDSPVVCVSQKDAQAYTQWLTKQTGFNYRLPTEIEWEVAALAGAQSAYWWGDSFGSGQANTGWGGTKWSNTSTSPVKTFAPNSFGFFDTVGNVWEWTNDSRYISKGGAWSFSPNQATAHSQLYLSPNTSSNYVGFRILRKL